MNENNKSKMRILDDLYWRVKANSIQISERRRSSLQSAIPTTGWKGPMRSTLQTTSAKIK